MFLSHFSMGRTTFGVVSKGKYDALVLLLRGSFSIPVKERTSEQKKAVFLHKKHRTSLQMNDDNKLTLDGKIILTKNKAKELIKKEFTKNLGIGVRPLYYLIRQKFVGVTEELIREILQSSTRYHRSRPQFLNKPRPRTIVASRPGERWQIDLIEMRKDPVKSRGVEYKYVLQIIDVYSRYLIPRALPNKSATCVAQALQEVMYEHGPPYVIQCDNGSEFKGHVQALCQKNSIKLINSRPYHPQSQGKCERANKTLKSKLSFATMSNRGFNWVNKLPRLAYMINKTPKQVLGYCSPFDVYHNRNINKQTTKSLKDIERGFHMRYASRSSGRISNYAIGENVLLRYPFRPSRIPKRRFILKGKVVKKRKDGYRYLVRFNRPNSEEGLEWVGVENITSLTLRKEKSRKRRQFERTSKQAARNDKTKQVHRTKYYLPQTHGAQLVSFGALTNGSRVNVVHDPDPNGNCQFGAIADQLQRLCIHSSDIT